MPTAQMGRLQLGTQLLGQHRQLLLQGLAAGRARGDQFLEAAFSWDPVRHQLGSAPAAAWQHVRFLTVLHRSLHLRLAEHGTCTQGWWEEARKALQRARSRQDGGLAGGSGNWNPLGSPCTLMLHRAGRAAGSWHRAHALRSDGRGRLRGLEKPGLEFEMMLTNRRNGLKTIRSNSKGQARRAGLARGAEAPSEQPEGRASGWAAGSVTTLSAQGSPGRAHSVRAGPTQVTRGAVHTEARIPEAQQAGSCWEKQPGGREGEEKPHWFGCGKEEQRCSQGRGSSHCQPQLPRARSGISRQEKSPLIGKSTEDGNSRAVTEVGCRQRGLGESGGREAAASDHMNAVRAGGRALRGIGQLELSGVPLGWPRPAAVCAWDRSCLLPSSTVVMIHPLRDTVAVLFYSQANLGEICL